MCARIRTCQKKGSAGGRGVVVVEQMSGLQCPMMACENFHVNYISLRIMECVGKSVFMRRRSNCEENHRIGHLKPGQNRCQVKVNFNAHCRRPRPKSLCIMHE